MKIRKIAAITLLVVSSFAANTVAPSKSELETMYDKAFREFDGNDYDQALKDLDAIDARQPDLAESQNLRGVILMRQKDYEKAEAALQKALAADPKFWNARFNLAEIPFLQKNWAEARKRFQELLNGNASELQGEATQLIQYKTLITYLMEGKENMVDAIKGKFELAPETPALQYAVASIALNKKDEKAAKDALTAAEKNFSPQLNKLFAESLYEVGWLEKPAGQTRAALELNSAAERAAKTKEFAKAKYDEAEQALQQRDMTAARKLVDEADAADPNQAAYVNLRGEILLEQKDWDGAENEFKKAAKLDPKFRDAQYNLAQIPFKKKEYTKARERFESLFASTTGEDKDRAAQLIKFKVYLTYLLEGKDSRAQKMMEQFQFTGDTPALYYAQAAWEFKHSNPAKANDWVTSARKIYSPALNGVFSDAFFDLGWLQTPAAAASNVVVADNAQPETAPSIEPTPLPNLTLAKNDRARSNDPLTLAAQANSAVPGMEATTLDSSAPASTAVVGASASPSVETPVASTASPAAAQAVIANASEPETAVAPNEESARTTAAAESSPATVLAPAKVREWSQPSMSEKLADSNTLLVGVLLLAALLLIAWVVVPGMRRRLVKTSEARTTLAPLTAPAFADGDADNSVEQFITPTRPVSGPPQVSLQLRASEPALRRAVMPVGRANGNGAAVATAAVAAAPAEAFVRPETLVTEENDSLEESFSEPLVDEVFSDEANDGLEFVSEITEFPAASDSTVVDEEFLPVEVFAPAPAEVSLPKWETTSAVAEEVSFMDEELPAEMDGPIATAEAAPAAIVASEATMPEEPIAMKESADEPIGQGQPVPYLTPAAAEEKPTQLAAPISDAPRERFAAAAGSGLAGIGALRHSVDRSPSAPQVTSSEPTIHSTTPATMAQPTPTTPAPTIRTGPIAPMTGGNQPTMQPAGLQQTPSGMHTNVQLTFSFEIASLQLTPNFKMGALQLKPTSKIVTMRLAPSQHPQPAMNLQVTFEIASVQLNGNSLGMIRLTPSQQQRPGVTTSPSFNITGLQLVSGSDAAPVQLTPSQQGQASVHVTAGFQIATVEFSPSFEIASIILNATSKTASVQLPGTGPSAVEGAPVFEIVNVQLGGNGELGMMQLNPQGSAPKRV